MPQNDEKVGPLKKIILSLQAAKEPNSEPMTEISPGFDFIFGIGPGGLTPFEYEISDRAVGDEVTIPLNRGDLEQIFQHLTVPAVNIPEDLGSFYLKVKVMDVAPADQREVIRALAELANCGDSCCGH